MSETAIMKFIAAANRYDTQAVLDLFSADAVIDDVSVGEKFRQQAGIRKYFTTYFIGYHTKTQLLALEQSGDNSTLAKIDFTGDFGHETGGLNFRFNEAGLILHIDAYLD
ncbi:SnoaL-like protein [Mucilaginibacter gracilis]|uniref:SnoaL-like protein n=1 Tax=Mucilaginibacter gracilis TaxID=423350 RepID=A0A495J6S1_9SPHI|nr:nuclear transport factor 2 family protein [Mucilaginibacter gracilis]RKR84074.1 SnoaL-like protein [Mucilaginibacter gracilis]